MSEKLDSNNELLDDRTELLVVLIVARHAVDLVIAKLVGGSTSTVSRVFISFEHNQDTKPGVKKESGIHCTKRQSNSFTLSPYMSKNSFSPFFKQSYAKPLLLN